MADINVTVASGTAFSTSNSEAVLLIAVENTQAVPCKASTNVYYSLSITDGTNTEDYTFSILAADTIAAEHVENFTAENTTLTGTITGTGIIYYTAA